MLVREGIEIEASAPPPITASFQFASGPSTFFFFFSSYEPLGAAVILALIISPSR
jgi:hypothetical protein